MKGLYLKDLYSLKRMMKTFLIVSGLTLTLAVMFVFSAKYGNFAHMQQELGEDFSIFVRLIATLSLLLPIAFTWQVNDCFLLDEKADFKKVAGFMPVSSRQLVLSRYLTLFTIAGIGLLFSGVSGFVLSFVLWDVGYLELMKVPCKVLLCLLIYCGIAMPVSYRFGGKMNNVALIILFGAAYIAGAAFVISATKDMNEAETEAWLLMLGQRGKDVLGFWTQSSVLLLITVVCLVVSYCVSVFLVSHHKNKA